MTTDCDGGALPAGVDRSVFGTTVRNMKHKPSPDDVAKAYGGTVRKPNANEGLDADRCVITHEATGCDLSYPNGSTGRTLSDRALELVNGDRQDEYGEPLEHCRKVAAVWAAAFGWDVDARKFALAMNLLKLVREAHCPKEDSRVDAVGWGEIEDQIVERLRP